MVDELLSHGADPNQALTHGLNNALCVATLPVTEANRSLPQRIALVCTICFVLFATCYRSISTIRHIRLLLRLSTDMYATLVGYSRDLCSDNVNDISYQSIHLI